jgi:hypothetical protein
VLKVRLRAWQSSLSVHAGPRRGHHEEEEGGEKRRFVLRAVDGKASEVWDLPFGNFAFESFLKFIIKT